MLTVSSLPSRVIPLRATYKGHHNLPVLQPNCSLHNDNTKSYWIEICTGTVAYHVLRMAGLRNRLHCEFCP
jgi:hypothetical protein